MCETEFVETARVCSTSQHAFGEHVLDRLSDYTFPVYTLTRRPQKAWSTSYMA